MFKYGKHNFKQQIVCFCNSYEDLNSLERFIVDKNNKTYRVNLDDPRLNDKNFQLVRKWKEIIDE